MLKMPVLNRNVVIIGAAIVMITVTAGLILGRTDVDPFRKHMTIQEIYKSELANLATETEQLKALLGNKDMGLPDKTAAYSTVLHNMAIPCKVMMGRYAKLQQDPAVMQQLKDSASNVKQLCDDLGAVVTYAQRVDKATTPYVLFRTSKWPLPTDAAFTEQLAVTEKITASTKTALNDIADSTIADPGREEQITLLSRTEGQIAKIKDSQARGKIAQTDALTDELIKQIEKQQNDLMNARSYFWRNTVHIAGLQAKLTELQSKF